MTEQYVGKPGRSDTETFLVSIVFGSFTESYRIYYRSNEGAEQLQFFTFKMSSMGTRTSPQRDSHQGFSNSRKLVQRLSTPLLIQPITLFHE